MSTTEINDQLQVRRDKMEDLRQNGIDPFGQRFDRTHLSSELVEEFGAFSKEELEENKVKEKIQTFSDNTERTIEEVKEKIETEVLKESTETENNEQ